jgi:replicative DNA helicase
MTDFKDRKKKSHPSITPFSDYGKIPPQACDLEEAIIGALLIDPQAYIRVAYLLDEPSKFYKEAHQKILAAVIELHEKKIGIDTLTVTNRLRDIGELESIGGPLYLTQLSGKIVSSAHIEFHSMIITDKYLLRELIRIGNEIQTKAFDDSNDPMEIAQWAEEELMNKFDLDIEGRATFKDALHSTIMDITNKAKGIVSAFIKTGDSEIDSKVSFRVRSGVLIAGAESTGKTKYVTSIVKSILDNNEKVRVLWFSMEDSKEQIVRSFISMRARLTTKQMQSVNYTLSNDEMALINMAVEEFDDYNIEFIDRVCSIATIMRKSRSYRDKHKDCLFIIVIDNLGLIETDSFYRGNEKDDYLAGKLKDIYDTTEACMFILHHITKESKNKLNINEGYRPRSEYIKGSTRILDYVQQAILVNLPRKYKDLVSEEKSKAEMFVIKKISGAFDKSRFKNEFWSINPKGDKNTKTTTDLLDTTWNELKFICGSETLEDGMPITVGYLLRKYVEYSISIDEINRNRKQEYYSEKLSIYTFLNHKKFKEDYKPQPSTRTFYLYGNDISRAKYIQELFIAECVKNRDGSDVDDQSIIRYKADLDHNIFIPMTDSGWEELKNSNDVSS